MKARRLVPILCPLVAVLLLAVPALAVEKGNPQSIVRVTVDSSALTVEPETELDNGRIRLLSPEGLEIVRDFKGGFGQITVDELANEVENLSLDGCWTYEIVGTPSLTKTEQSLLAESRETGRPVPAALQLKLESMYESGSFNVIEGRMVFDPNAGETDIDGKLRAEVPGGLQTAVGGSAQVPTGLDQQVISGDLVVYNSICVGFDCPTNPTFGADTIRLQENNLRIHFDDTSTASSFPNRDWRIIANDQANGGLSRFSVEDVTGGRIPFTIEAAAPSNSLYVENSGDVGFGTANPVLELHTVSGDSPGLRLEQDGSSGFQPQVWDLAGNETNFFVRDATNGSTLPFRIFPGSASSSLVIRNSNVGMGTSSPSEALHIQRSSGAANVLVEAGSGNASLDFDGAASTDLILDRGNTSSNGRMQLQTAGALRWSIGMVPGGEDLKIGPNASTDYVTVNQSTGDVTITNDLFVNGTCTGCDAVFQSDFELESIEEHAAQMWERSYLPAVGPTPEGEGSINVFEKTTGILQELEKAHIYIDQLNGTIKELKAQLEEKDEKFLTLAERLAALEEVMTTSRQ